MTFLYMTALVLYDSHSSVNSNLMKLGINIRGKIGRDKSTRLLFALYLVAEIIIKKIMYI